MSDVESEPCMGEDDTPMEVSEKMRSAVVAFNESFPSARLIPEPAVPSRIAQLEAEIAARDAMINRLTDVNSELGARVEALEDERDGWGKAAAARTRADEPRRVSGWQVWEFDDKGDLRRAEPVAATPAIQAAGSVWENGSKVECSGLGNIDGSYVVQWSIQSDPTDFSPVAAPTAPALPSRALSPDNALPGLRVPRGF